MRRWLEQVRMTLAILWLMAPDWAAVRAARGFGRWLWRILVWLDQGANVVFGPLLNGLLRPRAARFGSEDETLSSVFAKLRPECRLCRLLCRLLERFDPQHCDKSLEADERG